MCAPPPYRIDAHGRIVYLTNEEVRKQQERKAWLPVDSAPERVWLRTRREGEAGENVCMRLDGLSATAAERR